MFQEQLRMLHTPLFILLISLLCLGLTDQSRITQSTGETRSAAGLILVPQDYPTIQAAIDAAQGGDQIQVSPGTYNQPLLISGKAITLTSEYASTGDESLIESTIVEGGITIDGNSGGTNIIGFTIQNGEDGIQPQSAIEAHHNRIRWNQDGIDFEGGIGSLLEDNIFEDNSDDGIDLDGATGVTVRQNTIRNNDDDGIEIRIHDYDGDDPLEIVIANNTITDNGGDGIQIIEDLATGETTNRLFIIERNVIASNTMAGLGFLDNGDTRQDFRAIRVPDPVHFLNNTVVGNDHGISGSASDLVVINNIISDQINIALKKVDGDSIAAYNLFWNNGLDFQDSNVQMSTSLFADPLLSGNFKLMPGSPAIDAGAAFFDWKGEIIIDLPDSAYLGIAPDLGKFESNPLLDRRAYLPLIY